MCNLCKRDIGCRLLGVRLGTEESLQAEDWELVYNFMRFVQLPFIHGIVLRARERQEQREGNEG